MKMTSRKKRTLGIRKFDSILLASACEMIVGVLISISDTAITGHVIGMKGLSAMNAISPLLGFTIFTEGLFSVGTSMLYAKRSGEYEQKEADQVFGMGLMLSCITGVLTFIAVSVMLRFYLGTLGLSEQITQYVIVFMGILRFDLMLQPVYELVNTMITTDGDEYLGMASNIAAPLVNIVLSIILGRMYGIAGIAMGSVISTVIAFAILGLHFLSKRNSLRPAWYFSWQDFKAMCLFGWNDSAMFFVLPFLFYVITRLMIACWGESYLPVLSVLYAVIEMTSVFESTGEAMRPILPIYIGDKNVPAVLGLTKHSRTVNLILGFAFGGVLAVGAPWIPLAFDITDPALAQICIDGMRIFAIACPMLALMSLMNSYYLNTDKPGLAMLETILVQFLCPLVLAGLFIYFTSPEGLFVGYAASPYLAAVLLFAYIRIRYGREGFPYYIEDNTLALLDEGVQLDRDGIRAFTDKAGIFLRDHKVDEHIVSAVELTSDTVLLFIKEKNPDDLVSAECCLRIEPGRVYFSIWDSGEIFDITDAASGTDSFRSKVMARIIKERLIEKKHMTVTSFNRNAFQFSLEG